MREKLKNRKIENTFEKEKLLVACNFSFSYSVSKRLVLQIRKNQGLFGKGLLENLKRVVDSKNYIAIPNFYLAPKLLHWF